MKKTLFASVLAAAILLSGCAKKPQEYTIRFFSQDTLLSEQVITEGSQPESVSVPEAEGLRFTGWDQEVTPAAADAEYHAQFLLTLNNHVPYLFPREDGLLRPDTPFTGDDCAAAITALTAQALREQLPELPAGSDPITVAALEESLRFFYPEEDSLFPGENPHKPLTRSDAAALMNTLLGRTGESVLLQKESHGFADVTPDRKDYYELAEAAVPHKAGTTPWNKTHLRTGLEPGWDIHLGRLRWIDEDGYQVMDTVVEENFTIGEDGYFTCGNPELDAYVTEFLAARQLEHPEADRMELLRMAYDHIRDDFKYLRRNPYYNGYTGWEIQDAIDMFASGFGNCYSYAAMFWAFARGLGYDCIAVAGNLGERPHGWVIMKRDNLVYYCDPELEMSIFQEKNYQYDLFMRRRDYIDGDGFQYIEPWFG